MRLWHGLHIPRPYPYLVTWETHQPAQGLQGPQSKCHLVPWQFHCCPWWLPSLQSRHHSAKDKASPPTPLRQHAPQSQHLQIQTWFQGVGEQHAAQTPCLCSTPGLSVPPLLGPHPHPPQHPTAQVPSTHACRPCVLWELFRTWLKCLRPRSLLSCFPGARALSPPVTSSQAFSYTQNICSVHWTMKNN